MKSSNTQMRQRGYVEDDELDDYIIVDKNKLLDMIHSKIPYERTIAAKMLAKYNDEDVLKTLVNSLLVEKKLYPKIALSESISTFGAMASKLLIVYLGKVGNNQYRTLPEKPFGKTNYPSPRDIIARTICKIGIDALDSLSECLQKGTRSQILEAIDAVGYISFYQNDHRLKAEIIILLNKNSEDQLMVWKLLRALQSFKDKEVVKLLEKYQKTSIIQHNWEAARSLKQIFRRQEL